MLKKVSQVLLYNSFTRYINFVIILNDCSCIVLDLFASSSHSILASSLNMTPDHIEAARVFVETLALSKKHAHQTVVDVPPPDGDICTPAMLHDVLTFKWLNGAVSMCLVLTKLSFVLHNLIEFFCLCM